jgi:DNA-directed RNA polymerase subunit RPC12/RpoP
MAIAIRCPDCGKAYNLADDQAGQRVRCRVCNSDFDVTSRVETLETVPTDAVSERRGSRPSRHERPDPVVKKKSRKWAYVAGGLTAALVLVLLVCAGAGWVLGLRLRNELAQARAQFFAAQARAEEEARRAERDRELADKQRQAAEQQAAQLQVELNKLLAQMRQGKGVNLPDLAPIKDLDDALAKLKAKDSLTKIKALGWITEHSPYNGQQKKRVLDALRPLTTDDDPMVKAGAVQTQLIVEQDL